MWRVSTLLCTSGMATTGSVKVFISIFPKGTSRVLSGQRYHLGLGRALAPAGFDRRHDAGRVKPQRAEDGSLVAMIDEAIGQAQLHHGNDDAVRAQALLHGTAGATHDRSFFDADEPFMVPGQIENERFINGLDEAHVDHRGVELFAGLKGGGEQGAERKNGDALTLAAHDALAQWHGFKPCHDGRAAAGSARITYRS